MSTLKLLYSFYSFFYSSPILSNSNDIKAFVICALCVFVLINILSWTCWNTETGLLFQKVVKGADKFMWVKTGNVQKAFMSLGNFKWSVVWEWNKLGTTALIYELFLTSFWSIFFEMMIFFISLAENVVFFFLQAWNTCWTPLALFHNTSKLIRNLQTKGNILISSLSKLCGLTFLFFTVWPMY